MGAKGKPNHPWGWIVAELRARPGRPRLFPSMVGAPVSLVDRIRRRRARALHLPDGKLHAYMTNRTVTDDGREIADIWLCFKPTPRKDKQ